MPSLLGNIVGCLEIVVNVAINTFKYDCIRQSLDQWDGCTCLSGI